MNSNTTPTGVDERPTFWAYIKGGIDQFTQYLVSLEEKQNLEDSQLVGPLPLPANQHFHLPHAPIQTFTEATFAYNYSSGQPLHLTDNAEANNYIEAFSKLGINIFELIRATHTLPDPPFVRKRYLAKMKLAHPDRNGATTDSIDINVARDKLEELYSDANEQISLFHAVLNTVLRETKSEPIVEQEEQSTRATPYILLFLVGSGLGLVYSRYHQKKV